MKCQNCGKNEANFFQRTNINGNVTETHLCAECAEKLGYFNSGAFSANSLLDSLFEESSAFTGGFFRPFFTARPRFGGLGAAPASALPDGAVDTKPAEARGGAADSELSRLRYINILREQMRAAAATEDFERAMELREEIKKLEG